MKLLSFIAMCFLVSGCSSVESGNRSLPNQERDAWFREPASHSEYLQFEGARIDKYRVHEVRPEYETEAEQLLAQVPVVEIDFPTAIRLVGTSLKAPVGYKTFLTRGLCCSKSTGKWSIYEFKDKLQIGFFALGNKQSKVSRQPLVLFLKDKPSEVFVMCGVVAQ